MKHPLSMHALQALELKVRKVQRDVHKREKPRIAVVVVNQPPLRQQLTLEAPTAQENRSALHDRQNTENHCDFKWTRVKTPSLTGY